MAPMTAEELLRTPVPDKRVELVRGMLVVREPAGYRHGDVTARLTKLLMDVVDARGLGRVLSAETGFQLSADPDTVRAPDVAFISRASPEAASSTSRAQCMQSSAWVVPRGYARPRGGGKIGFHRGVKPRLG